ncbi:MAG: TMCO4 family protein [Nitrosopumilus sp.]|nr:TMCO4 family protein [Nitrosopumilus sp.]MDH5659215.1 TMCO4 family protein [Nitrosopumilus sp.]
MKPIPRISTRGYYDLTSGKTLKTNSYYLYPKRDFKNLMGSKEFTIMIHGLRNDNAGAIAKVLLAKNRLRKLGYRFPVVGFSYDSNTTGAHLIKYAKRSLVTGQVIAKKNGRNLGKFIEDFNLTSPKTKIRLMGHSLGSQVILSTLEYLAKKKQNYGVVNSTYLFGASITEDVPSSKKYGKIIQNIIEKKITNYYAPTDEVLSWADNERHVKGPLGLNGAVGKPVSKYHQKLVKPKNHRFASYIAVLNSFP